ncbi:unnamed protein product [Adineta steineri]|uniref:Ras and EF-hand domain-containing protein n=1 Tax=Adineta steineri TaxID=433720 RepID=A0A814BC18_9BILA|nr:unnamed protein product [Adineta steineri]
MLNSDGSGYIDKEKLHHLCPHLSSLEIDTIFNDFDNDHDNRICLKELLQSNNYPYELSKQNVFNHDYKTKNIVTHTQINEIFNSLNWMNLISTKLSDDDIFSNQEQIFEFYETLRNGSSETIPQFQNILEVFVCDILKYRKEIKGLEDSYKREKDTHEKYLKHIEEVQEQDMLHLEDTIREEERNSFDHERELYQQRSAKEINELKSTIQRLQTIEQRFTARKNEEDSSVIPLREEIAKLIEENQTLNASLNETLTTNAILQSDIQSFKTQLNERQTMLLQEKQSSSSSHRERDALQTNVRHLVEVNKQLRDENDSLRAVIETNKSNNNSQKHSLLQVGRLVSTAGSTIGNYWNKSKIDSVNSPYSPSPSYTMSGNQRKFASFDLESCDEIGILENKSRALNKVDVNIAPKQMLSMATVSTVDTFTDDNNTMNDSGLSLATGLTATEVESERDIQVNKKPSLANTKQYRSLLTKRTTDDTDSDDVFVEVSLDRNNTKRQSQPRLPKRANANGNSSGKQSATQSPALTRADKSLAFSAQDALSFDRMFKVVFCGDAAVGKSTLIMRLCKGKFESSANATLGVDFQNKQIEVDGKRVALQLWDTAGQERFRSIAKSYFRRCDGVILVYDATYERSFLNVREWIDTITDSTPKKVSVMIVANKIDLRDQMRAEGKRVIEKAEGIKLAKEYKALFIETSAKDGTNSEATLVELARDMQCNEDLERFRTVGIDLDKKTSKKSTCC